ncbi:PDZ domain-containing protein/peptidase M48-like protein [Sphingomonas sp. F9_3S_D5_B_2]
MSKRNSRSLACTAVLVGSALWSASAGAAGLSIRQLGAEQLRLRTIGYRIAAASSGTCRKPQMLTGLVTHDLTQYQPALRTSVSQAFSLRSGFGVLQVVAGSVAEQAGFKVDDEIVAVDGRSVEDSAAVAKSAPSYQRMERFSALLTAALSDGPADVLLRRGGGLLHVRLKGQPGCGGETLLVRSSDLNAWSDGAHVYVSSAMMRLTGSDEQLAFVVAHELAHNILGHSSEKETHGLLGAFGIGAMKIRREEVQADSTAVPLMSAAGYAPLGAVRFLESARSVLWWNFSLDHPGFGQRIRTVDGAIARLAAGSRVAAVTRFASKA